MTLETLLDTVPPLFALGSALFATWYALHKRVDQIRRQQDRLEKQGADAWDPQPPTPIPWLRCEYCGVKTRGGQCNQCGAWN